MLDQITPVVLTRDEEVNIGRTLAQLRWARDVVVVDSCSQDRTVDIAGSFPNVRVFQREIDTIAGQSNFGLQQVRTPWALLLDADYFVPDALADEFRGLQPEVDAYRARFQYAIGGRPLRASLYPPRIVLFRCDRAHIWQDGHTPRIDCTGPVGSLRQAVIHDDRKNFTRFIQRQRRYMRQEAVKLRDAPFKSLPWSGRIRKLIFVAPAAVVVHTLFVKRVILDGIPGLRYTTERFLAELILSWELLKSRFPRMIS